MDSVDFCYWLQGLFELGDPKELNAKQVDLIKKHLNMVFVHEIDPSYGDKEEQAKLNKIHNDLKPQSGGVCIGPTSDVLIRC